MAVRHHRFWIAAVLAAAFPVAALAAPPSVPIPELPVPALPGMWSIPAPLNLRATATDSLLTQNGFQWAPAPAGGTGSAPLPNLFALRLEVPGDLVDLGVAQIPFDYGFAGVVMPSSTTVGDITRLSFDTFYESGVTCGGGSPRYQLAVDQDGDGQADGNVFVYAGPYPNFNGCPHGVWTHEDLMTGTLNWDSTQFGGPFYGTQADAAGAVGGGAHVLSVGAVWDSWWMAPGRSVIWLDNLRVNNFLLDEPVKGHVCSLLAGAQGSEVCP
jgi:hypothetical protein